MVSDEASDEPRHDSFDLVPIGVVHSRVIDRRMMPPDGVEAEVEVFPEFRDGLLLIEENTHLWIFGWFIEGDRNRLQIIRPSYESSRRRRGVFGLRSTARPNSIAASVARLLELRDGRLRLERLDLIDGTPVLDIKRYSPSADLVFSARSSRDRYLIDRADPARFNELEQEASSFTGARNSGVVVGTRLVQYLSVNWDLMPKDDELIVTLGTEPSDPYLCDAVQALTGATFGSGRLRVVPGNLLRFDYRGRTLVVELLPLAGLDLPTLRRCPFSQLFRVIDE